MTILNRLPMTKALRELHRDVLGDGFPVGITFAPRVVVDVGAEVVAPPYVVLVPLGTDQLSGPPFTAPNEDARWPYQVTLVAKTGTQLEWMRDKVVTLWLDRDAGGQFVNPIDVEGMSVIDRNITEDLGGEPLGGDQGALTVSTTLRFVLEVTPAAVVVP